MSYNARQARAVLDLIDRRCCQSVRGSVNAIVDQVAGEVRVRVPHVTGRLARTLQVHHAGGLSRRVQASVSIGAHDGQGDAAAVEFGTARMRPRPFFRISIGHVVPSGRNALIANLRRSY